MWNTYMEFLKFVFTPTDIEVMHMIMVGIVAKVMLSGLKWVSEKMHVELNRTTIQVATLPVACLCLYLYTLLTNCPFDFATAETWGQTLVSSLTSIGLHEASKTSYMKDVKKLVEMIFEKLKKKSEAPKV